MNMKRALPAFPALVVLGAALLLGACGLETYLYLEAPGNYTTSPGTTLIFQHSTANTDSSFLGYEVYYRLYPGKDSSTIPDQATMDINAISSKISAATGADQVIAALRAKGFTRMSQSTVTPIVSAGNPPFTPIDSTDIGKAGIRTYIDLSGLGKTTYKVPSSADQIWYCARSVIAGGSYLPFSDFTYSTGDCASYSGDADYVSASTSLMLHPYLVAYAFAYALESDFTATYSYPTLLNSSGTATDISGI